MVDAQLASVIAGIVLGMLLFGLFNALFFHGLFTIGFRIFCAIIGGAVGYFEGGFIEDLTAKDDAW